MRGFRPSSRGAVVALLLWFAPSASSAGVAAGALAIAAPAIGHHRVAVRPCAGSGFDVVVSHEERRMDHHAATSEHPPGLHVEAGRMPPEPDHVVRCMEAATHGAPPRSLELSAPPVVLMTSRLASSRPVARIVREEHGASVHLPPDSFLFSILRI